MQALDEASPRPLCIRRHLFARRDAHGASAPVPLVLRAGPVASLRRGEAGTRGAGPGAGRRAGRAQSPRCGRAAHVQASTAHPRSGAACSEVKDPAETPQVRSGYTVRYALVRPEQRTRSVSLKVWTSGRNTGSATRRRRPAGQDGPRWAPAHGQAAASGARTKQSRRGPERKGKRCQGRAALAEAQLAGKSRAGTASIEKKGALTSARGTCALGSQTKRSEASEARGGRRRQGSRRNRRK